MSGTRNLGSAIPASPIIQGLVDPDNRLRPEWRHFFTQLWTRTGGAQGTTPAAGVSSWNSRAGAVTMTSSDVSTAGGSVNAVEWG